MCCRSQSRVGPVEPVVSVMEDDLRQIVTSYRRHGNSRLLIGMAIGTVVGVVACMVGEWIARGLGF